MAKTYNELKNYINSEITTKKEKGSITPFSHGAVLQEVVDFANENGGGSSTNYSLIITDSATNTISAGTNDPYLNLVNETDNIVVNSIHLQGEGLNFVYNLLQGLQVVLSNVGRTDIDNDPDFENGIKVIESITTNSKGQITGTRKKILPNKKYVDDAISSAGVITGKHNVVDLRTAQGFNENTFYPVTIAMQDATIKGSSNVRIRVMHNRTTLSASERPAWMTNSQGVTLCTEWEIGFGDYTKAGFSNRLIYNNQWWYAETNPCRKPMIFQKTNTETFYLRGGGKYDIYTNIDVTINFGASIVLDASNTLTAIQTDGTTTDIESKVTAFPQEVKRQSTAELQVGANKVLMEFSEGAWDMLNNELKNAVIEKVATMPTTNHMQGRVVTSGATGRQKLYLNIGNGWDLMASEFWASSNFVRKTETGNIMYDIINYTTSNLITQITTNLGSSMLYHHILLTTNTEQIGNIMIPLATIYAKMETTATLRLKNKKFIIDFPNAVASDYSKTSGIQFLVDFGMASSHNNRYEPMVFFASNNTNLVPELHFTLISNNTFVWVEDVQVYFKEK